MRGITGTVVQMLCMSVVIAASHIDVRAQNTILVGDLHNIDSTFVWDTTVFATRLPSFALGHQWGAADLFIFLNVNGGWHGGTEDISHYVVASSTRDMRDV